MSGRPFVFFDLGGTLVDLRGILASIAARLAAELDIPKETSNSIAQDWAVRTAERLPAAQGPRFRPEREIAADVLFRLLEERRLPATRPGASRLVRDAWADFVARCTLQADVTPSWIHQFRARVAGLAIVTDGDTEAVMGVLDHLRIRDRFDCVTISEDVRSYKPDATIYRAALDGLAANPAKSLFVSDSAIDLHGAGAVGMATAFIDRGVFPGSKKVPAASFVLSSLPELGGIVEGFSKTGRFARR